jgi:hypothetical protein
VIRKAGYSLRRFTQEFGSAVQPIFQKISNMQHADVIGCRFLEACPDLQNAARVCRDY